MVSSAARSQSRPWRQVGNTVRVGAEHGGETAGHDPQWVQDLLRRLPGRATVTDLECVGKLLPAEARAVFYACLANGWIGPAGLYTDTGTAFIRTPMLELDPSTVASRTEELLRRVEVVNASESWVHWVDAVARVESPYRHGRVRVAAGDLVVHAVPRHPRHREHELWSQQRAQNPSVGPDARASLVDFLQCGVQPLSVWCSTDPALSTATVKIAYHRSGAAPVPLERFGTRSTAFHPDDRARFQSLRDEMRRVRTGQPKQ